jgi:recombination DNA repair RAD52 pathway protein
MDVKEIQKEKDAKNKWTVVVQVIVRVTIIRSGNKDNLTKRKLP